MYKKAEISNCNRTWWKLRLRQLLLKFDNQLKRKNNKTQVISSSYSHIENDNNNNNNNNNNSNNKNTNNKSGSHSYSYSKKKKKKNQQQHQQQRIKFCKENEESAMLEKSNWTIVQEEQQLELEQQQSWREKAARRRNSSRFHRHIQMSAAEAVATATAGNYSNNNNYNNRNPNAKNNNNNNKFNKSNKSLITIILLLITTTMTATICQRTFDAETTTATTATQAAAAILTATATATATMLSMLIAAAAAPSQSPSNGIKLFTIAATVTGTATAGAASLSAQQQQQQRQLFAMLSKNGQQSLGAGGGGIAGVASMPRHKIENSADHDDDDAGAVVSLETIGFVSDDGDQRYEKAEKALAAAAAAEAEAAATATASVSGGNRSNNSNNNNNNNGNCPKECTCLNDFFDCGKKHLDRVPTLPNYVQTLDLVGNKLNDTAVLQIRNLPELKRLTLKRNQLDVMPKFAGLTSLRQLNLANNRIQRISSEAILALPKLRLLDLSRNYLHTIEADYFPADNRLAHLILNANVIASIDEGAFERLKMLADLELNSNRLSNLPAGVFKNLSKLKKLSLNSNNLEINWSTFKGLESIQKLSLQSNNIRALQDGVFHVMHKIESIELDHNSITSLSRQGLFNLTKLHNLSVSNNSISRIELDTWEFTQSLVSLDLSNNNISEFKPQHLDCLQQLRQLNLGHNKIQYFTDSTFDCVKNLEDLNLKRNRLAWIIEDAGAMPPFKSLRKLKKLDLSGNNLKQINSKSLSGLTSLEQLNLEGNALASIQKGAFEQMTHLQRLKFKSMNFICDCEILWFRRWLQTKAHASPQMQKNAICGYPDHLLDRELLTLTPAELVCADSPKPVIVQEPTNQLAVKGANITMECIASSPAAASLAAADELKIKWRHDNQNLRERIGNSGTTGSTPPSNNGGGGGGGGGGPTQLHTNNNHNHNYNHHHHLHYNAHHHHNHHAVSNSFSTTETQIHHDQSTNQTSIIGYLRLYNVSYESAGRYQCVVSNAFGTTYSQKFKLSIGIHPRFLQIPSNLTIDSGDTARLVCSATGDPTPEIALQKFGASDFPAATERRLQVVREENAFIITNAKPIDTGIYTCTAESAAGEIKINASLVVNDKPQPSRPLAHKEVLLGSSSVLECLSDIAAELQNPHREWFKDNKPFHTSTTSASERYYFTTEKELLVIVNTQSMDVGLYRCEITDDSKTFSLQTKLIVVEDINQNMIIIASAVVACILVGLLFLGALLCYQRRKMYLSAGHSLHSGGGGSATRVVYDSSHRTLSGSRGSALDQTQLTTLNRSYLRSQYESPRPRSSYTDLEMNGNIPPAMGESQVDAEQRNCLIVSKTPNYQQQQLLHQQQQQQHQQSSLRQHPHHPQNHYHDDDDDDDGDDGTTTRTTTDAYLRRNSLYDAEHQQDHLSSKDSGTGSDAAVKRSIDDFTIALLPLSTSIDISNTTTHPRSSERRTPATMPSDDDIDSYDASVAVDIVDTPRATDSDTDDIATSPVLGISDAVEFQREFRRNDGGDITSESTPTTPSTSRCAINNQNNSIYSMRLAASNSSFEIMMDNGSDSNGGNASNRRRIGLAPNAANVSNTKCKQDLSTSYNADAVAAASSLLPATQAVDI